MTIVKSYYKGKLYGSRAFSSSEEILIPEYIKCMKEAGFSIMKIIK